MPFLIIATEQRRGRGRGGNHWHSPAGNFYGTFAVAANHPAALMAQVSFVAALALAKVLEGWDLQVTVKWPNDVLVNDAKISGILLEKHGSILLVGLGLNVASHPDLEGYAATSLAALGLQVRPDEIAEVLAGSFWSIYQGWLCDGFAPVRQQWLARAKGLGQPIAVRLAGQGARHGLFHGLGPEGALQLRGDAGIEEYHAGEVYFHATCH